jgi:hypothetical protein
LAGRPYADNDLLHAGIRVLLCARHCRGLIDLKRPIQLFNR